jgi:transcription termination/antitermination protein NusG
MQTAMGRRFRARATKQHNFILPTEIPIPAEKRNVVPDVDAAGLRWYVCTTAPQQERRAAASLRREAERLAAWGLPPLIAYVPCDTVWKRRTRGSLTLPRLEVQTPRLRSYVFVAARGGLQPQHLGIMSERDAERQNKHGLIAVLGSREGLPISLPAGDRGFLARMAEDELAAAQVQRIGDVPYEVGERVTVTEGPFRTFGGPVRGVDPQQSRLLVELDILGRATPIELDFGYVSKAA